jgi:hypothetical protein
MTGGQEDKKKNVQHSTFNAQRSTAGSAGVVVMTVGQGDKKKNVQLEPPSQQHRNYQS